MKRIALLSLLALALFAGCLLLVSQPSVAQSPARQPVRLVAQQEDPFGAEPGGLFPPVAPLRNGEPNNGQANNPDEPLPPEPPVPRGQPLPVPAGEALRDPTTVSPDIRAILDPPEENTTAEPVPLPRLSGRISLPDGRTMAVIAIGEEYTIVEEGDQINFPFGARGLETMEIMTLSPTRVEVKLQQLGRTVSLR